jgi:spore maturation protein SpmB
LKVKIPPLPRAPFAVVAIAIVLLGMAGLIDRVGLLMSAVVFILGTAALPYAYAETRRAAAVPFLVGALLVMVGGVGMATDVPTTYGALTSFLGVVAMGYGAAVELPRWHSAFAKPFRWRRRVV